MEKILIDWLENYTQCTKLKGETKFSNLNFDVFDEAMTVDFVSQKFGVNINTSEQWFDTVDDLIRAINNDKRL